MSKSVTYYIAALLLMGSPSVLASECRVQTNQATGAGGFVEAIEKAQKGQCSAALSPQDRARFEAHVPVSTTVQLIRFEKSGTVALSQALPRLHGPTDTTLVIQVHATTQVQLSGSAYGDTAAPLHMDEGSNVIVDGLGITGFPTTAVVMEGQDHLLIRASLSENGSVTEPAIRITSGKNTVTQCTINKSAGDGIHVLASGARVSDNDVHHNQGAAILLSGRSELHRNGVHHNKDGISIPSDALVSPVDLIDTSALNAEHYRLMGSIGRDTTPGYPWDDAHLDLKNIEVEIFLTDDVKGRQGTRYLTKTTVTDLDHRRFTVTIPKPIMIDGKEVTHPIFVAIAIDPEHHTTSRYSDAVDVDASRDWDKDGISNSDEDVLHTDPRLPDTDGDGLTDGEEHLHIERIKSFLEETDPKLKISFKELGVLNPTMADSDGDCLPDGLELGIEAKDWPPLAKTQYSVLQPPRPIPSSICLDILKAHKIDFTTVHFFDTDPQSKTDPTAPDTDGDQLIDGAEDWNWDGVRAKDKAGQWVETDPMIADSDGDELPDGEEDRNDNGILDKAETSPLLADTDHDGVKDAQELRSGSTPTSCDSDQDGLPDGIENNVANIAPTKGCEGAAFHGSNFAAPSALSSSSVDSDSDGLKDGDEDKNHNGWLDPEESDPTVSDTDGDGISDYIEMTNDLNHDAVADFFLGDINNGGKCAPPEKPSDMDCDGLSNAQDTDSDNDGCPDRAEGLDPGSNTHGIPAAYTRDSKQCGAPVSNGGGGGLSGGGAAAPKTDESAPESEGDAWNAYWAGRTDGGGNCSLLSTPKSPDYSVFFLAAFMGCVLVSARNFLRPKS